MHAVIHKENNIQEVPFGGSYRECWTEDYRLSICYSPRPVVQLRREGESWIPVGGDEALCRLLRDPACPELSLQYAQAAAEVAWALSLCREMGLALPRLPESFRFPANPLCAPELVRALMDDAGFPLDLACRTAALSCPLLAVRGLDMEALYALQGRTAHVLQLLCSYADRQLCAEHDSRLSGFRSPFGAVRCGERMTLRFRLVSGKLSRASLILWGDSFREEIPMEREGDHYAAHFSAPEEAMALWYCFRMETESSCHWLCPEENGCRGQLCGSESSGFRLTVCRADFETPTWFQNTVMYQIFPDRFAFSDDDTAKKGIAYHKALGQTPELHESVEEPVRWQPRAFEEHYSPDDFYGGTLRGIEEKLPYLKELGIGCLYLNPIVEARSNHRYDASDYRKVDPILGDREDFRRLCEKAGALGIRLMLDGVFSHTGADSLYFNRCGSYPEKGACQGPDSPYYDWYDFKHFPEQYRCWWGFQDLPEVEETRKSWQDFVISGENSVVKHWLRLGAAGWRLDVADELPDEVLALIRRHVKGEKPDAPILGEVWEDAVIKESYGGRRNYALGYSLDSVMNYPFRSAMLDFIHGRTDAFGLRDFLTAQQMNYPRPMYYSLMNLLGSHDTDRIRTALATPVLLRALSREEQLAVPISREDLDRALQREKLCAALQFAIPGVPSVYYGDEQGMCGTNDPFNRLPFQMGDGELEAYYRSLAARRNASSALRTGEVRFAAAHRDLLLVLRYDEQGAWLLALNRGREELSFCADCSAAGRGPVHGTVAGEQALFLEL